MTKPELADPVTHDQTNVRRRRDALRVLLVDDEDMVRRCTARSLSGFEIVCASSGDEALAILSNDTDFDAVLSDVMMPLMSGPEMFEHCYELYPRLAQRFVFASGDPDGARPLLLSAVARVGAEQTPALLTKPSATEALKLALVAAAAHEEPRSGTWAIASERPRSENTRAKHPSVANGLGSR